MILPPLVFPVSNDNDNKMIIECAFPLHSAEHILLNVAAPFNCVLKNPILFEIDKANSFFAMRTHTQ
jgi:hypothetical protein